jgi:hypothetical protein
MQPSEDYVLVPMEYAERGLAYRVHTGCFERLRTKAEGLLKRASLRRRPSRG